MKIIAFYLPQYHAIPENDKWWGKGFTEWVNVKKSNPLYKGHHQPKVPLNNFYYNLLNDEVKKWQISLAKENGIYGFCFYHYWFSGKLMLEKPIEQYLKNKELDFPFCLSWANPEWTRVWAGEGSTVLIEQEYNDKKKWEDHLQYLLPFFRDRRYITIDGEPLFVIYAPAQIDCIQELVSFLRMRMQQEGFLGIKLAYQYYVTPSEDDFLRPLFDYCISFQPVYALHDLETKSNLGRVYNLLRFINKKIYQICKIELTDFLIKVRKTNYDAVWQSILNTNPKDRKDVACAFVNWDNTPRRGQAGRVIIEGTPKKFEQYMRLLIKEVKKKYSTEFIFFTAWNEWSEGSYLEPDELNKYEYLASIKRALDNDKE